MFKEIIMMVNTAKPIATYFSKSALLLSIVFRVRFYAL